MSADHSAWGGVVVHTGVDGRHERLCKQLTSALFPLALAALAHGVVPLSSAARVVVAHTASLLTRFHVNLSVFVFKTRWWWSEG